MATLYEYYNTGDTGSFPAQGAQWQAQTFTVNTAHAITSVKLLLYRENSPGTITASIRATASGLPTGADLTSGTSNGDTLTTATSGEWREVVLTSYSLTVGTKYAIVIRVTGSTPNVLRCRATSDTTDHYTGGAECRSLNSGGTWSSYPDIGDVGDDILFEDWGNPAFTPQVIMIV